MTYSRERNIKPIAVKPLNTLGEYSSDEQAELDEMTESEDSEEEVELLCEAVKKARQDAKERQLEIEAERREREATTTSRSKRGRSPTMSSVQSKRSKKT